MPTDVHIRPADSIDAGLLADLGASTFLTTYADDVPFRPLTRFVDSFFTPIRMRAELDDPDTRTWLAEIDGSAVGYLVAAIDTPPAQTPLAAPLAVRRLYLTADAQGRSVGRRLVERAEAHASRSGCDGLWLTVWEGNARARAVYTRWGFVETGRVPFEMAGVRQIDVVLSRPLPNMGEVHRSAPSLRRAS